MNTKAKILVVDDEASMRDMVAILLRRHGYVIDTAGSCREVKKLLAAGEMFDLVITDLLMEHGGGLSVLSEVKQRLPNCEVIVITAYGTAESAVEAMKKGAHDYIAKPFNIDEFIIVVRQALERQALIRENIDLRERVQGRYKFADIVGRSEAMRQVIDLARRAAESPATVLLSGESGTGKEVVARALHYNSARAKAPFVAINCGALPEQLMESELFGHVRGTFTGATADKEGLFRAGDKGTVFLDEVGELPAPLQVKLLRVLQDHKVRPVGASAEQSVDVRIISATNQDLDTLVKAGRFRTDLFYRLNVIHIALPPLRERPEDIPPLVEHIRKKLALEQGRPIKELSPEALRSLLPHSFPGNVRELANMIERAATLAVGARIEVGDLPAMDGRTTAAPGQVLLALPDEGVNLDETLERFERSLIDQALARTNGVRTHAAALLGITFRSFRYRLKKLGLGDERDSVPGLDVDREDGEDA